ncbi:MAG: hypothetical protein ACU85E_01790 [Gammaproteobacteria bacterium]
MFANTLPIIFGYGQLIGPVELLIIFSCLYSALYISSPDPYDSWQRVEYSGGEGYQYLLRAWFGELTLRLIFWPFFLVLNAALYAADTMVKSGAISVSSWGNIHIMLLGPVIWWTVSVWRGSGRTRSRWWSACARLAVLCAYLEFGMRLFIRMEFPRIFFNCEELLLDYFSCF